MLGVVMRKRELSSVMLLVLLLLPLFAQGFDIDRNIGAGEFYAAFRNADAGWRIEGSFTASKSIEFIICDADNYNKWVNNQTAFLYEHQEQVTSHTFNFTVPHEQYSILSFQMDSHRLSLGWKQNYTSKTKQA
jgi:hypothetical protein